MTRGQRLVIVVAAAAAILVVLFPPRHVGYSYYPVWYGGLLNWPRLVLEMTVVLVGGWSIYQRVSGRVRSQMSARRELVVGLIVVAAVVAFDVLLWWLMSASAV